MIKILGYRLQTERLNIMINKSFFLIYLSLILSINCFASFEDLTFAEAWQEERFNGRDLTRVMKLYPAPDPSNAMPLTPEQKQALIGSQMLINLRTLDLRNQGIDDNFINELCQNHTFSRVITIRLSGNPAITKNSLEAILQSPIIGSIRDLPQISGRYGCPASEIHIDAQGTAISLEELNAFNNKNLHNFSIKYIHPIHNRPTAPAVTNAVKTLNISSYY